MQTNGTTAAPHISVRRVSPNEILDGKRHRCFVCRGQFRFLDDERGPYYRAQARARDGLDPLSHLGGMTFAQAVRESMGSGSEQWS